MIRFSREIIPRADLPRTIILASSGDHIKSPRIHIKQIPAFKKDGTKLLARSRETRYGD